MFFNNNLLKLFYSAMLTGIPSVTYNPINNNIFHAPVVIKPFSTYINYRLNFEQYTYIKNILDSRSNNLLPIFSNTLQDENKDYYLSVNIYNCSSPIFNTITQDEVTRCEINTYVTDSKKNIGTVIMDYCSNYLSMDPVNIFKLPDNISMYDVLGVSFLCGIGFTMSLFINSLAFTQGVDVISFGQEYSKSGIFFGSIISGILGYIILKIRLKKNE